MKPSALDLKEKYSVIYSKTQNLLQNLIWKDTNQFAEIVIQVTHSNKKAPLHLFIGPDANALANLKIERVAKELKENETLTTERFLKSL